jgi:predicted GIY-YIG superfamily endonuclease
MYENKLKRMRRGRKENLIIEDNHKPKERENKREQLSKQMKR